MGDCHFAQFSSPKSSIKEEKYCKYTYAPWCPTCEKNSPRHRTRSETMECRRKCREMKHATPKNKYNSSYEYENMSDIVYNNDWYSNNEKLSPLPSDSNRNRSNLCELPTTYICNNDKIGVIECLEKSVKTYEQALKITENLDRAHHSNTITRKHFDLRQTHIRDISYDTETLFDKFADNNDLQEKIDKEIDLIRQNGKKYPADAAPKIGNNTVKKKSRVYLKTRSKMNVVKMKKLKVKITPSTSASDFKDSYFSSSSDEDETEVTTESLSSSSSSDITSSETTASSSGKSVTFDIKIGDWNENEWPLLRPSIFPHMPPYLNFCEFNSETPFKVPYGQKLLKWKSTPITPPIVRKTLTNSGFVLVQKSNQWLGSWAKHMKSPMFKTLKNSQKLNHFPGTFQIGRKDRLWENFQRLANIHGSHEFGFLPQTFILPRDIKQLKRQWSKSENKDNMWIMKPPASARGTGIKVINKWAQLPKQPVIVQKYVQNPYLINDSKFDLRLYVLVTSFNPLRIYLYSDGLARFASVKYSELAKDITDRYRHLTNYSINRFSSEYTKNEDANSCQGHKWTIKKLFEYMEMNGIKTGQLWKKMQDVIIKTILLGDSPICKLSEDNMNSRYNCYELFGIDILLDEKLKPWLLEVNISPSINSQSPVDVHVKGPMMKSVFDMAQFHLPPIFNRKYQNSPPTLEPELYYRNLSTIEKEKHTLFEQYEQRVDYLYEILENLTGDDVRHLIQAEDEYLVKGNFQRIFPTSETFKYFDFMENRYYNRLFDAWEHHYESNRGAGIVLLKELCEKKIHLQTVDESKLTKNGLNMNQGDEDLQQFKQGQNIVKIMQQVSIETNNLN